jgi:hypothetical protein
MVKGLPAAKMALPYRAFLSYLVSQCYECDLTAADLPGLGDIEECILSLNCFVTMPTDRQKGTFVGGLGTPFVLRTTKPFDWAGSVRKWLPGAEKATHAGRDYFRTEWKQETLKRVLPPNHVPAGKTYSAVFVADARTIVFGDESQVHQVLDRLKAGKPGPTPPPGWKEFERDLIAVAYDTRTVPCVRGRWPEGSPEAKHARTLAEGIGVLAAGVTVGDRTEVRLTALARDPEAARKAVEALRQLLAFARNGLVPAAKGAEPTQTAKLLAELLESVEIVRDGQRVRARAGVSCNVLHLLAAALQQERPTPPVGTGPPRR